MSFGNIYKIPFSATLTTNPCDLVGILAPSNSQVVCANSSLAPCRPRSRRANCSRSRSSGVQQPRARVPRSRRCSSCRRHRRRPWWRVVGDRTIVWLGVDGVGNADPHRQLVAAFQSYMYCQDDPAMRPRCDVSQRLHIRLQPQHSFGHRRHCDHPRNRSSDERIAFEPGRLLLSGFRRVMTVPLDDGLRTISAQYARARARVSRGLSFETA